MRCFYLSVCVNNTHMDTLLGDADEILEDFPHLRLSYNPGLGSKISGERVVLPLLGHQQCISSAGLIAKNMA